MADKEGMTKQQIRNDLTETLAEGHAPGVERAFNALVFFGAQPYTPRGVSDAGLTDAELSAVAAVLPSGHTRDWIIGFLASEG